MTGTHYQGNVALPVIIRRALPDPGLNYTEVAFGMHSHMIVKKAFFQLLQLLSTSE